MIPRAHLGPIPVVHIEINDDKPWVRWMGEHGVLHVPDVRAQNDLPPSLLSAAGARS